MFQAVLTSNLFTKDDIDKKYTSAIIKIGDNIMNNHFYGTKKKINYIDSLKTKNLYPLSKMNDGTIEILNNLFNSIKSI